MDITEKLKLAMLISGGGTTAAAIIQACQNGELFGSGLEPALVVASKENIDGIERIKNLGFLEKDIVIISPKDFSTPEEFGTAIIRACRERNVDIIGQYGWLHKTPANVVEAYKDKMINQHPGPLDPGHLDFGGAGMYGRRVHSARLCFVKKTNRDFRTEATAQKVAANYDEGAVLYKKTVEILPDDTVESLQARVLPIEHSVQIETLKMLANGTLREIIRDDRLINPGEKKILEECKKEAVKLYPNG